jgi:NgoBV restriction endonuclease
MSAVKLFEKLKESGIVGATGTTHFELHGIKTLVQDNSVIGNVIQEWLASFMAQHKIAYTVPDNTQEFPDYFVNESNGHHRLLEVKCFKKSPNFDIANFMAYCRSLTEEPRRLDAQYLIFEYAPNKDGIVIKRLWLKKVWEITGASERAAVKIQWKQNQAVNIRPATWYSKSTKYPPFTTRKDYVLALKKVLDTSPAGGDWRQNWIKVVEKKYQEQTGQAL